MLVVFFHAAQYTMDFHQGWTFHALFEGAHGVDLFFVISGLCLSYPVLRRATGARQTSFDLLTFLARRAVRIVPCYWIAFAIILAVALAVRLEGGDLPWPAVNLPSIAEGFRQLLFLGGHAPLSSSFWTLAVEFRWYLAFPLILWLYIRGPFLALSLGALSLALYHFTKYNPPDFAALPAFLLGIVAADLILREHRVCRYALPLFIASVGASLLLEPRNALRYAAQDQIWWQVSAFFLVLSAYGTRALRSVLSWKPIAFVGATSYSIYLLHDPVEAWYGHYGGQNPLAAALAGVLAGILGWMLVERFFTNREIRDRIVGGLVFSARLLNPAVNVPRFLAMPGTRFVPIPAAVARTTVVEAIRLSR